MKRNATTRAHRYKVGDVIGRGGMGEVVAARDTQIAREVAIKRLRDREPTVRHVERFIREAQIQGRLDHPAIAPVYELGSDENGQPFFVMKKLAGRSLAEILRSDGFFARKRLMRAFVDVCLAIEYAHVHGVIHRDIKPSNIVLGDYNDVYIIDWGVAKVIGDTDELADLRNEDVITSATGTLIGQGPIVGTRGFMAPEQAAGGHVDERSDVYALGKVLDAILRRSEEQPPELVAVRELATRVAPADRLGTARELGERVQRYLDGDRDLELRKRLACQHLAAARAGFAERNRESHRASAIREAGSAVALDPTNREAVELVGRLMLEPPSDVPPAVERMLDEDDRRMEMDIARAALWGFLGFLALVPSLVMIGQWWCWLGFAGIVGANVAAACIVAHSRIAIGMPLFVVANAFAVAFLARLFSPILIAPAVAVLIGITHALNPMLRSRKAIAFVFLALLCGIEISALLENVGVLPATLDFRDGGILLFAPGLSEHAPLMRIVGALYIVTLLVTSFVVGRLLRRDSREARKQGHMQAWQLRQLVPEGCAPVVGR